MIKASIISLLLIIPNTQYALTVTNWRNFYIGAGVFSTGIILACLNETFSKYAKNVENQRKIDCKKVQDALTNLNVKVKDYYGYKRSGNSVDIETIVHNTSIDIPQDLSPEQAEQIQCYWEKLLDLREKKTLTLKTFAESCESLSFLSIISGLFLMFINIDPFHQQSR